MTFCKNISPKKRELCVGDLNKRVRVQVRSLISKGYEDTKYGEDFKTIKSLWAALETTRGYQSFSDVGIENNITHKFYIRYSMEYTVTSEDWIEYKCDKYKIVDVENLDENDEYLLLFCTKKGSKNVVANFS